jgi:hypothetical protein
VWPSAGPAAAAAAAAAPLPVSKGLVQHWEGTPGGHHKWYRRELPYSYDMLIENLADPCECNARQSFTELVALSCVVASLWPFAPHIGDEPVQNTRQALSSTLTCAVCPQKTVASLVLVAYYP